MAMQCGLTLLAARQQLLQSPARLQVRSADVLTLCIGIVRQAFEALGTRIEDHVQLVQVGPAAYRVHFEGGGALDLLNDVGDMQRQLESVEAGAGGFW